MRISSPDQSAALAGVGYRDAESLFRTKPISEIRNVESNTRRQIEDKKEELRQLIGNRYRDLIESADSILSMKSSCEAISGNIDAISESIYSLSLESNNLDVLELDRIPNRAKIYGIACRVKYLVDTPENIWGCLDEFMFLESAARYVRAKLVNRILLESEGDEGRILSKKFPLLSHQWQLVEGFKAQISQRSRERLLADRSGVGGLAVGAFADALAGVAVVDELRPQEAFGLFLESRKSWIMQRLHSCGSEVVSVLCDVTKIMQVTVGQVGELFLQAVTDMPLFYKMVLDCPPASQLFGGIPSPDEEVRLWNEFRDNLVSVMVILDRGFIAKSCSNWLRECGREIVKKVNGRFLLDSIASGAELASAEKQIRETMDSKHVLEGSLEWLRSVFGSEIELPWSRTRELLLEEDLDLWNEIFEDAFVQRMKVIIDSGFEDLNKVVNVSGSLHAVGESADTIHDFHAYLNRTSLDGGVWFVEPNLKKVGLIPGTKPLPDESDDFRSCLDGYFGPEASRIRDAVDNCCQSVLEDLLCFLETPKASLRLKDLVPYLQSNCYQSISTILKDLNNELERLRALLISKKKDMEYVEQAKIVEKSLFIGRLLFAFQEHSEHIPKVLGPPRLWIPEPLTSGSEKLTSIFRHSRLSIDYAMPESPGKHGVSGSRTHTSMVASALYGFSDAASPKLEELVKTMRDVCIASHSLWILWLADELSSILSNDLRQDDGLSATISLKGWEEITVKQEQPGEAPELKISLPCMPSLYVTSFLYRACEEIHRVGGHVLDKTILQQLALRLLESVINVYGDVIANHEVEVSEKGALQVLLDIRFAADILSGGDSSLNEVSLKSPATKYAYLRKQEHSSTKSVTRERVDQLHNRFSQKLDPIDWQTYEPYLWENEKQSYLRHAVIFGFFVQLNRLYTDTVQKLPTNSESNLMRCSTVPRFKYLPISAPALSSRNAAKTPLRSSSDDITSRSSLKAYANGELSQKIDFDENSSFGVATPFLKSFMQVGSKFGESTFKLGSMLTDGQVGRLKDRSASAMSTFGDILPMQASGLFSSLTATRSDS